ncbi:4-hydroxybenzoate 3-monooxygenase [Algirhabdus cladophorae]|uniref:4-hydroxybenzoate 3-monooxygenase n=1 Tax=Algirhabdus cladophorae TaxID=3377108 RepID=UPI003B846D2D
MPTQVCIIGGGPSGMLLAQLLKTAGHDVVVLERQSRAYVLARIRAGVLEQGTVDMLRKAGVASRLDREGYVHGGTLLAAKNQQFRIDFDDLISKNVTVYGQTEVTKDLYDACGDLVIHGVANVDLADLHSKAPVVSYQLDGTVHHIKCDFVIGCDGYHGVSRRAIPSDVLTEYERVYPFGWLGVLSETPPVSQELIYANHSRGFALCSMRNEALSRYYIQSPVDDPLDKWTDDAFWDELRRRLPQEAAENLITGPSIEKSIAPLRSFVAEPMRWGALFLVGDAAHIVPPTGAKGLNLAVSDVHYLFEGLIQHYAGDDTGLDRYSEKALTRVWSAIRFSWWFTTTMHSFPGQSEFDQKIQESELALLAGSRSAQTNFAENYVGRPF